MKTSKKNPSPESLITEILKMDRLNYLEIIQQKKSLTSLQMTREILAPRKGIRPEQVNDDDITKYNPNINKRLKDLADLEILNDREGKYSLSPIGFLFIDELSRLKLDVEIIKNYKWFFDTHDYTVIPPQQFREIHTLQFAKQCNDYFEYKKEIENNTAKTQHEIYLVTERLHDIPIWIMEEFRQGNFSLKLSYQFKEPFKINSDDEEEQSLWKELTQEKYPTVELRYLVLDNRNPIGIRIIDKSWATFSLFEYAENKLNRPRSFYGTHKKFIAWIEDIFSDIWNESNPLDINSIHPSTSST